MRQFDRRDAEYGIQAERERNKRILDYVMRYGREDLWIDKWFDKFTK